MQNKNISQKETHSAAMRRIAKYNTTQIKHFEALQNRKHVPDSEYLTTMNDADNMLEFDHLSTHFFTDQGVVKAVDGVSFVVPKGMTVGVVGESGCGKSVTSLSAMRLVQRPAGQIVQGSIRLNMGDHAVDLVKAPMRAMQKIRGNEISMIFQEPMTSLNPVFTVGNQIDEIITIHNPSFSKEQVKARTIELFTMVGMSRAEGIYKSYPHELSGGMRQRAMIAMALSCNPKLIIADEPTTALDVTIQAQILDLLRDIKRKINASIMLITHDLGVVAEMADYVVVMYAGRVIEHGTVRDIFHNPSHPYTIGLLRSKPVVGGDLKRLYSIPGQVPSPIDMKDCCFFKDRCEQCLEKCSGVYPPFFQSNTGHEVACWRYEEGAKL